VWDGSEFSHKRKIYWILKQTGREGHNKGRGEKRVLFVITGNKNPFWEKFGKGIRQRHVWVDVGKRVQENKGARETFLI